MPPLDPPTPGKTPCLLIIGALFLSAGIASVSAQSPGDSPKEGTGSQGDPESSAANTPRPAPGDPQIPLERSLAARVDSERAATRVRELCELGTRMGGTASGERAAAYLAKAFGSAGLAVTTLEDPEAWCHEEASWSLVAHGPEGETLTLERAWPHGFSPACEGRAELSAEPKEGCALLLERKPRGRGYRNSPAIVLVDGWTTEDGAYPRCGDMSPPPTENVPRFGISRPEGETLRAWLAAGHGVELEYALEAKIERASPKTVVASLAPRLRPDGTRPAGHFLFSAHGDSDAGGPGADDNASGEAVLLEIATVWAEAVREGHWPAPPVEVRFAIWGKEIHSSRAYLRNSLENEDPILGVLNYDQAGFGSGGDRIHVEPDDLAANLGLVGHVVAVLEDHAADENFPKRWVTNKSLGGTDSYVFSGNQAFREGMRPALTLFSSAWHHNDPLKRTPGQTGESWNGEDVVHVDHDIYYHSAGDTPENTTDKEPYNLGWCARVGLISAARWLESDFGSD